MTGNAPKAVIFDFGGVVTRTLFETHDLTERALGLPQGTLQWRGPFDPDSDPLWQRMQADEISERDYWHIRTQEVASLAGTKWSGMSDLVMAARGSTPNAVIRPEFLAFVADARMAGLQLAILSNELDLFYGPEFREKLDFLKYFSAIHDATYTGILKPDPQAYLDCLASLGVEPNQCLFIDDQHRNVAGAQSVGMQTVHFDVLSPARSYDEAQRKMGI